MQKLKQKHKEKLQHYTQSINSHIQELQFKKLYSSLIVKLPFVDDYRISYVSHTDRVSEAQELGDILLSGLQDLVSIVVEDGLGIKEYRTENEESNKVQEFREEIEEHYPPYMEFDVSAPINKTIKKLEDKGKTDTLYYQKLKTLSNEIANIRTTLELSFKAQRLLQSLEWKFIKIITAVGLTHFKKTSAYEDVARLEKEARKICKKLVTTTKEYDSGIQELALLQV